MTTGTISHNGLNATFVGDDALISAATNPRSPFSTSINIRDTNVDTLLSLRLSPLALRELAGACSRAAAGSGVTILGSTYPAQATS